MAGERRTSDCELMAVECACLAENRRLRAALETAEIEAQHEIAAGAIAHAQTIAALAEAERLLMEARPHVYRQQHRGAHEQDRADAVALLSELTASGYLRGGRDEGET